MSIYEKLLALSVEVELRKLENELMKGIGWIRIHSQNGNQNPLQYFGMCESSGRILNRKGSPGKNCGSKLKTGDLANLKVKEKSIFGGWTKKAESMPPGEK